MIFFFGFVLFIVAQRLFELRLARRNELEVKRLGAIEYDRAGYGFIVVMHAAFFVSLVAEKFAFSRALNPAWIELIAIFAAAQLLRYWAIHSLGMFWNTKILVIPGQKLIRKGPYRFIRHPNYVAVVTEIAVVPLVFSCYLTAVTFTLLNAFVLSRRISIELEVLNAGRG